MAWHILRLYIELTGRSPGVSIPSGGGKRGGPAVRFLDAALQLLGWSTKPSTAAGLIDELKDDAELSRCLSNPIFKSKES